MKNFKIVSLLTLSAFAYQANAQTTGQKIGTNPTIKEASAVLELAASDKGFLVPRVALTSTSDVVTILSAANALTVFNTATVLDVTPGYYYWNTATTKWIRLAGDQDLRYIGTNSHITQDAGVGSNGTSVGTGTNVIAIGNNAGSANTSGTRNIGVGLNGLLGTTSGNDNIGLGANSGANITTGSNNIAIGANTDIATPATSNQLNIGNVIFGIGLNGTVTTSQGFIGIGQPNPQARLHTSIVNTGYTGTTGGKSLYVYNEPTAISGAGILNAIESQMTATLSGGNPVVNGYLNTVNIFGAGTVAQINGLSTVMNKASTGTVTNLYLNKSLGSLSNGDIGGLYGNYTQINLSGTVNPGSASGFRSAFVLTATTTADIYGLSATINGNGSASSYAGLFIQNSSTGTIGVAYGVWIKSTVGTVKWGIFQEETTVNNAFAGNVRLGSLGVPRATLDAGIKTDGIILPNGTTLQRPVTPVFGTIRYNSIIGRGEMYVNDLNGDGTLGDTGWRAI